MTMTKNEVAKALYKQKPVARRLAAGPTVTDEIAVYQAKVVKEDGTGLIVEFRIPLVEMEGENFGIEESAQLLRRWLYYGNTK